MLKFELDDGDMVLFLGIGSLINHRIPKEKHKVIFGTGVGYGTVPVVDKSWTIYSVRGPLSARALRIDEKLGVCDSAILLRTLGLENRRKKHKFSYINEYINRRTLKPCSPNGSCSTGWSIVQLQDL